MGAEGNHEGGQGFEHYANRFAYFAGDNTSGMTQAMSGLTATPLEQSLLLIFYW